MIKIFISILVLFYYSNVFTQSTDTTLVRSDVDTLIKQSRTLLGQQQYDQAIYLLDSSILISKNGLGNEHAYYAKSIFNKAFVLYLLGKYDEALLLYFQAEEIQKRYLGIINGTYANTINNIGIVYYLKDDFGLAEKYYLEAKEIRAKAHGVNSKEYSGSLNNLALLYRSQGDNPKSILMFLEAKEIWKDAKSKLDPGYAHIINNIGLGYVYIGAYEKAEPILHEAQEIWEKTVGKAHPDYALSLDCLGYLYNKKGEYSKAEPIYIEVIKNRLNTFGKDHVEYASAINNLGTLYMKMGDYKKGESLCIEAKEIREKLLGKEHNDYAESLINLANLYTLTLQYDKIETLLLDAKSIWEKTLGKEHTQYSIAIQNLANHYYRLQDFKKAEPLYFEAISIREKVYGKHHESYAEVIYNLATMYLEMENYTQAEKLTLEAKEIWSNSFGKANENYINTLGNLSSIYQRTNRVEQCVEVVFEMNELIRNLIETASSYSSENQMHAYLQTFERQIGQIQAFSQGYKNPGLSRMAYNNALFYNGFLMGNIQRLANSISGTDSVMQETFKNWRSSQRKLSIEYAKPIAERKYIAVIESEVEVYEKQLAQLSSEFKSARTVPLWDDVRNNLLPGSAAIEFVHYNEILQSKENKTKYAALVIKHGDTQPQIIPLFEESKLLNAVGFNNEQANSEMLTQIYKRGITPAKSVSLEGLYDIILKPLESILQDVGTIYYSPSGLLHRINFDAIPIDDKRNLSNKFQLVRLGSTRSLIFTDFKKVNSSDLIMLYGGINYNIDTALIIMDTVNHESLTYQDQELSFSYADRGIKARESNWSYLPGTESEINGISKLIKKSNFNLTVYSGNFATEESFKYIGKTEASPRVLHIATHGFFFPDLKQSHNTSVGSRQEELIFKISDHPMIRSGLILAGGNYAWKEGKPFKEGMEDGILTAYEISQMNLSNTELVVLSACETGLGDIQGDEGVYGLQRAFKIAGVKYLIMSLWQVPDKQTSLLMTTFYKKWLESSMSIPDAFHAAQKELRDLGLDPYQWAGFVLVE